MHQAKNVFGNKGDGVVVRRFNSGQFIFREYEMGDIAFVVQSGSVEIMKTVGEDEVILDTLGNGALFGEMALIDNEPRMASARAVGDTTVMVVDRNAFDRNIGSTTPFVRALLNILTANTRTMSNKLATIAANCG